MNRRLLMSLAVVGLALGCQRSDPSPQADAPADLSWFEDVTEQRGLRFVHDSGSVGSYFMPQIMGSGAALFDFNNDGLLDIYLLQNGGPKSSSTNRLYRQRPDGRFEDVSSGSGLDIAGYNMGVAVGDVNNDGWPDVLVTQYGGLKLFLNRGNGTFAEVSKEAGLHNPLWGTSACFFDYDQDGWLDLVVTNYVDYDPSRSCDYLLGTPDYCPPRSFPGSVTRLFHNRGAEAASSSLGRFEDVTVRSGLGRLPGPGLGVVCVDCNGDGWPDILVANDARPNRLWINQHDGTFAEEGMRRGLALNGMGQPQGNMGIAVGDVKGPRRGAEEGLLDFFITHLTEERHALYVQGPRGIFHDGTASAGLTQSDWHGTGFGTVLGDFDQDGRLDLALVNGRVSRHSPSSGSDPTTFWDAYRERSQLFANQGNGRFQDISSRNSNFCGSPAVSRGLACGDVNNDGALDLLVTNIGGRAGLYLNTVATRGHWLLVRAVDPRLQRDAYGAIVMLRGGDHCWTSLVHAGGSYLCSNDPRAHFGLGELETVDEIQVLWPDGMAERFPGGAVDRIVVLRRGEGHGLNPTKKKPVSESPEGKP